MKDETFLAEVTLCDGTTVVVEGFWVGFPADWAGYTPTKKEQYIKSKIALWSNGMVEDPFTVRNFQIM